MQARIQQAIQLFKQPGKLDGLLKSIEVWNQIFNEINSNVLMVGNKEQTRLINHFYRYSFLFFYEIISLLQKELSTKGDIGEHFELYPQIKNIIEKIYPRVSVAYQLDSAIFIHAGQLQNLLAENIHVLNVFFACKQVLKIRQCFLGNPNELPPANLNQDQLIKLSQNLDEVFQAAVNSAKELSARKSLPQTLAFSQFLYDSAHIISMIFNFIKTNGSALNEALPLTIFPRLKNIWNSIFKDYEGQLNTSTFKDISTLKTTGDALILALTVGRSAKLIEKALAALEEDDEQARAMVPQIVQAFFDCQSLHLPNNSQELQTYIRSHFYEPTARFFEQYFKILIKDNKRYLRHDPKARSEKRMMPALMHVYPDYRNIFTVCLSHLVKQSRQSVNLIQQLDALYEAAKTRKPHKWDYNGVMKESDTNLVGAIDDITLAKLTSLNASKDSKSSTDSKNAVLNGPAKLLKPDREEQKLYPLPGQIDAPDDLFIDLKDRATFEKRMKALPKELQPTKIEDRHSQSTYNRNNPGKVLLHDVLLNEDLERDEESEDEFMDWHLKKCRPQMKSGEVKTSLASLIAPAQLIQQSDSLSDSPDHKKHTPAKERGKQSEQLAESKEKPKNTNKTKQKDDKAAVSHKKKVSKNIQEEIELEEEEIEEPEMELEEEVVQTSTLQLSHHLPNEQYSADDAFKTRPREKKQRYTKQSLSNVDPKWFTDLVADMADQTVKADVFKKRLTGHIQYNKADLNYLCIQPHGADAKDANTDDEVDRYKAKRRLSIGINLLMYSALFCFNKEKISELMKQTTKNSVIEPANNPMQGFNAIHVGIYEANTAFMDAAIENKMDLNKLIETDKYRGLSPLMLACVRAKKMDCRQIIAKLLANKVDVNIRLQDPNFEFHGWSAIDFAIYNDDMGTVKLLLAANATLNCKLRSGKYTWEIAAKNASPELKNLLSTATNSENPLLLSDESFADEYQDFQESDEESEMSDHEKDEDYVDRSSKSSRASKKPSRKRKVVEEEIPAKREEETLAKMEEEKTPGGNKIRLKIPPQFLHLLKAKQDDPSQEGSNKRQKTGKSPDAFTRLSSPPGPNGVSGQQDNVQNAGAAPTNGMGGDLYGLGVSSTGGLGASSINGLGPSSTRALGTSSINGLGQSSPRALGASPTRTSGPGAINGLSTGFAMNSHLGFFAPPSPQHQPNLLPIRNRAPSPQLPQPLPAYNSYHMPPAPRLPMVDDNPGLPLPNLTPAELSPEPPLTIPTLPFDFFQTSQEDAQQAELESDEIGKLPDFNTIAKYFNN